MPQTLARRSAYPSNQIRKWWRVSMVPIFEPFLGEAERIQLIDCIDSGWISSQGPYIAEFERLFGERNGMPYAVATSNCTTALHLAIDALGLGAGDEILCPNLTFIAPANMIRLAGATPVLVDVDPVSWAIDPIDMAARITPRTRAIMVVHPFGHAADMDPIMELARRHDLKVIEDVAEAPEALYKGRMVGTFGDAACYSFFANKVMTTGEGGMVLAGTVDLDTALRIRRDHGMSRERRYYHVAVGYNYRMTNMQAAIGVAQINAMDQIMARRDAQAAHYANRFAENSKLAWRPVSHWCRYVHWMSTITLRDASCRDPLIEHMKTQNIDCRPMVLPVSANPPYNDFGDAVGFPVSYDVSARSLHLPSSTALPVETIDRIADTVLAWLEKNG